MPQSTLEVVLGLPPYSPHQGHISDELCVGDGKRWVMLRVGGSSHCGKALDDVTPP